jgi:hypothetical protein
MLGVLSLAKKCGVASTDEACAATWSAIRKRR